MEEAQQIRLALDGWIPLQFYEGFWYPDELLPDTILVQQFFRPQPDDIFVCSPPQSGTTWLLALTFAIATRTRFAFDSHPLLANSPHDCVPSFDDFRRRPSLRTPDLPLISTHTPYTTLPKYSIERDYPKIIYICREPKDTFVSMYHYVAKLRPSGLGTVSMNEAFDLFCRGNSPAGPFWDHILGFWKASLERPEKVLFLKYGDMVRETSGNVEKIADFMGYPFSAEEKEAGTVEKIVELCSFEHLRNLEVNKNGVRRQVSYVKNSAFFRKGGIGDWKNHLTAEMAARLDRIVEEKFWPLGLKFDASS